MVGSILGDITIRQPTISPQSTHTADEIRALERNTHLSIAGYLADDRGYLIPVLLRPDRSQTERIEKIRRLNSIKEG